MRRRRFKKKTSNSNSNMVLLLQCCWPLALAVSLLSVVPDGTSAEPQQEHNNGFVGFPEGKTRDRFS